MELLNRQSLVLGLAAVVVAVHAYAQAPGSNFRDCTGCPEMVVVPSGNFKMGSPRDFALSGAEVPRHEVTIGYAFAVGRFEVTRSQFEEFVKETGYAAFAGKGCVVLGIPDLQWVNDSSKSWQDPGFEQTDDHPVVCVSWEDAKAYLDWISRKSGKKYRLLSEAEWEYASRAGSKDLRPWGDDEKEACRHANVWDETYRKQKGLPPVTDQAFRPELSIGNLGIHDHASSPEKGSLGPWYRVNHWCSDSYAFTAPVGKLEPNGFGLHDAIGNAWEWVEDCLNSNFIGAPSDGSVWQSGNCELRVLRGGSWTSIPWDARAAKRLFRAISLRRSDLGFRVARELGVTKGE